MMNFKFRLFRLFLLLPLFTFALIEPALAQVKIKVVDQENKPLPNVVLEYDSPESTSKQPKAEKVYIMDQINKQFAPHVLIVPEDSFVSFPNSDDIRHHVYSFSPAKTFELKLYAGKPKSPVRFENTGVVVLGCNIHDSMIGYIYVSDSSHTFLSDEKGEVVLTQSVAANTQLKIWHPNSTSEISERTTITLDQAALGQDVITLTINIEKPEAGDSFEELNLYEY